MCAGKAHTTGESQSGSGQTDESPEVVINHILVGDGKEVMISQIVDMSLPENEDDKLEGSILSGDDQFSIPKPSQGAQTNTEALARH